MLYWRHCTELDTCALKFTFIFWQKNYPNSVRNNKHEWLNRRNQDSIRVEICIKNISYVFMASVNFVCKLFSRIFCKEEQNVFCILWDTAVVPNEPQSQLPQMILLPSCNDLRLLLFVFSMGSDDTPEVSSLWRHFSKMSDILIINLVLKL